MKRIVIFSILSMFLFSGCAWFQTKEEQTAPELAADGMDEFQNGSYKNAIEAFEQLKDWYPFSKYAILAELKIGDAYYHLQEYEDAIFAYEEFEGLHPSNEAIPYVIYQVGLCYFEQIDTIDRDQSTARKALYTFQRLIRQFPGNPYAVNAGADIRTCIKSIAGNDFYVGLFYYKSKHYRAAMSRFESVLTTYPDVGIHLQALEYLALSEKALQSNKKK
jgi:outer membrane protein assembly factor BamD